MQAQRPASTVEPVARGHGATVFLEEDYTMKPKTEATLPYEESAETVTVTGWSCKTCKRWWADNEHMARWCCASDLPCDCGGRREKHYTCCVVCRAKRDFERYEKMERVEWDGKTPLVDWGGDRYCWCVDDVQDLIDEDPLVWLVLCRPVGYPLFDMGEFLQDYLPDPAEYDIPDASAAEKAVNNWIAEHSPFSWAGTDKVPSRDSLARFVDLREGKP